VLRTARFNGTSVLFISGGCALLAAALHNVTGAVTGVVIAAAGAMELYGAGLLRNFEKNGMRWLVGSQLFLLTCILFYANYRLNHFSIADTKAFFKSVEPPEALAEVRRSLKNAGVSADDALREFNGFASFLISVGSVIYQGGMAIYYRTRQAAVITALQEGD
jgi:membrane-bound ClpP family serine protease